MKTFEIVRLNNRTPSIFKSVLKENLSSVLFSLYYKTSTDSVCVWLFNGFVFLAVESNKFSNLFFELNLFLSMFMKKQFCVFRFQKNSGSHSFTSQINNVIVIISYMELYVITEIFSYFFNLLNLWSFYCFMF